MNWNQVRQIGDKRNFQINGARVCQAEDVGQDVYDSGVLYVCPPKKWFGLQNFGWRNNQHFTFSMRPTRSMKVGFIDSLTLYSYQMDQSIDYSIQGEN